MEGAWHVVLGDQPPASCVSSLGRGRRLSESELQVPGKGRGFQVERWSWSGRGFES